MHVQEPGREKDGKSEEDWQIRTITLLVQFLIEFPDYPCNILPTSR